MVHITTRLKVACAGLALLSGACTVSSTDIPSLSGPSELALAVVMTASPDTITQDGSSQSTINLSARDGSGKGLASQAFRLDILVGGVATSFGTLSARTVVTGSDGRANFVFTAPAGGPNGSVSGECSPALFSPQLPGQCVTIAATAISNGFFNGTNTHTVDIHLVPVVVVPVPGAPFADFSFSPATITTNQEVFFNASASVAAAGHTIVNYAWDWGDGTKGIGILEDHDWATVGSYFVTLTITDEAGNKGSTTKTIKVT
jgi:hypothetical protein